MGVGLRLARGFAQELEHLLHVRQVVRAYFRRPGVVFQVVVAIGEPESALVGFGDIDVRVLVIRTGRETEQSGDVLQVQARELLGDGGLGGECVDAIEVGLQRFRSEFFDGRLIHAGGVEIADLLFVRRALGIADGGLFEDVLKNGAIAVVDQRQDSPAGLVGRNRVLGHPGSAGVLVEVLARIGGQIHVGGAESRERLRGRRERKQNCQECESHI